MQNDNLKLKSDLRQRTYKYALEVIKLIDKLPKNMTCEIIGKQLLRSATSIGANVVEAKASSSKRDFTNFFNHALKSANESKFWLEILRDSRKVVFDDLKYIIQETYEISNILASSILTLKGRKVF